MPDPQQQQAPLDRRGLLLAFTAYLLWGAFPLYFNLLRRPARWRSSATAIFWSFLFCFAGVLLWREWGHLRDVLRNRRLFWGLVAAGLLVSVNWLIYVWGVLNDHIVDASLGYFINPLFTVALAVLVLKERLRTAQKVAVASGGWRSS